MIVVLRALRVASSSGVRSGSGHDCSKMLSVGFGMERG